MESWWHGEARGWAPAAVGHVAVDQVHVARGRRPVRAQDPAKVIELSVGVAHLGVGERKWRGGQRALVGLYVVKVGLAGLEVGLWKRGDGVAKSVAVGRGRHNDEASRVEGELAEALIFGLERLLDPQQDLPQHTVHTQCTRSAHMVRGVRGREGGARAERGV